MGLLVAVTAAAVALAHPDAEIDLHIRLNFAGTGTPGASPSMVPFNAGSSRVTWELPAAFKKQGWFIVDVTKDGNGTAGGRSRVYTSGKKVTSEQNCTIHITEDAGFAPAASYYVQVKAGASSGGDVVESSPQPFFTSLAAWDATPMWSAPCPSGSGDPPEFAHFYNTVATDTDEHVESALAFVTADSPLTIPPFGCCGEAEQGSKLLGGYKLIVDGAVIGIGHVNSIYPRSNRESARER